MANERVLVIDDSEENNQFVVDYVLKPNGYQPLTAFDGEEGLKTALQEQPDLILLDMSMPKMDGIAVLEALNEREVSIPVIVMTFHGSETLAVQVFRLGVKDYVVKPFSVEDMLAAIERALSEARLRKERDELTERLMISNQQLEQRIRELNTLFGIGKSVTSVLNQDRLLSRLVEAAVYLTNAEEGSLLLVDSETNELYMVATRGIDDRVARSFRLQVEDSLAGQVITSGQPLIYGGDDIKKIKTAYLVRSLMYVPLKLKGEVRGVLNVNNRTHARDFTSHDLRLLSTLADYAAISLENARLFTQAESEQNKLTTLLNEIAEPVVLIDQQDDLMLMANAAFRRLFKLDTRAFEATHLKSIIDSEALINLVDTTPEGSTRRGEISTEEEHIFAVTLIPLPDVGRAIIMQDITHFKALDQVKSEFVSTVSHDLRTPLVSLKGYADMMGMVGSLTDKQQLFLDRMGGGIEKMLALIDNLLDLSKIEAGFELETSLVDLNELTMDIVAELQEQARRKPLELVYLAPSNSAFVIGDEVRLRQVITNLIGNAIKYTPEKGQVSTIMQVTDNQILFKVEDNGLGIPATDVPFIFDKFFRVQSDDRHSIGGTGLGLAISKSIIEKHGGTIWVESQHQQGSTFAFTLNLAPSNAIELNDQALPAPEVVSP